MTVSTTDNRVSYAGNGVTTAFSFPNLFFADSDLVVLLVNNTTGASTTQTLTTHYTVSGAGDPAGGTVTMLTAPATGYTLVIYRDPPLTQTIDLVNGDAFDVDTGVERGFDKNVLIAQRLYDLIERAMRFADSDTSGASLVLPAPSSNTLLGWNSGATALENKVPADLSLVTVTAFINTLLDDATAAQLIESIRTDAAALTSPAADDELLLRDTSATGGKRITLANLFKVINGITALTSPDSADEIAVYDASGAAAFKMTLANLLAVINTLTEDTSPVPTADYALTYDASASAVKKVLLSRLGPNLLHVYDEKSTGTNGGTATSGSWETRTLNTVGTNGIAGASLASNQITLAAGTYDIFAVAPAYNVTNHKAKLYNTTATADVLVGTSSYVAGAASVVTHSIISGRFTLAAQGVLEIRHQVAGTVANTGYGVAAGFSTAERYTDVQIRRVV